jgi:N-acetylmuramoyl-L-alanine amidase
MYRRWQRTAAVFLLLPGFALSSSGIIQVTGIHFWTHPESTRFIFDTTGPFEVHSERETNPDKLLLDLRARPWIGGQRSVTRVVDDKLVRRVRVTETSPGNTRISFDLTGPVTFKVSRLDKPDRLFVEIRAGRTEVPAPLPYVSSLTSAGSRPTVPFVYPPNYNRIPRFRTPVLMGSAPALTVAPPLPPYLPDAGLQIALAKPPRRTLPLAAAPALSTKVIPAPKPVPYEGTPRASENASRSLTRALGLKVNRIVIDAGHGGHDDGTIGPNGVLEKDVVLDVALRLAKLVQSKMGAEVVLTRSDDTFIPLQERTVIANERKADLFLSIHANSSPAASVAGTETFFLNFTNSPAALDVAARENAGADKNVGELKDLIQSITLNDKIAESETFAQQIQNAIFAQAAKSNVVAKNRGVKRAPFVVLIGASMPSVLAEIGFLSNPRDEANLAKPEYRQKIAESLLKGLTQYSQSLSHFEVAAGKPDKPGY